MGRPILTRKRIRMTNIYKYAIVFIIFIYYSNKKKG